MAFENSNGLNHLAETMAKDPSVISRNLQKIAEDLPVLKKMKGRWELTPLGFQINQQTKNFLHQQLELLTSIDKKQKPVVLSENSVLIIINAQKGLLDATQEGRNNSEAEKNICKTLEIWRAQKRNIIHVKHVSENPSSTFFRNSSGCEILEPMSPKPNEDVIEKTKSSAFANTNLEILLNQKNASDIYLTGFTANECIDASAREAAALGFSTFVVGDATASFDIRDVNGKLMKADRIHRLTLANINALYAKVLNTNELY